MGKISILLPLILFLAVPLSAQVNRYAVFFADKDGSPYSIAQPEEFLSARAILRRQNQNITIQENDLPVNPLYIAGLLDAGANVFYTSRWFNMALVQMEEGLESDILTLQFVSEVRQIAPGERLSPTGRKRSSWLGRLQGRTTNSQINQLGLNNLHDEGFLGSDVFIAVFDSGFEGVDTSEAFSAIIDEDRLTDTFNFVLNSQEVYSLDSHGTEVLSVMGASVQDEFVGASPRASFALYLSEDDDSEYPIEEFNWLMAAERADSVGVDIINSSLGYNTFLAPFDDYALEDMDGNTTVVTRAADLAASKGMLVVTSAGNEGNNDWGTITAPADADSVISVGSVNSSGFLSSSSSGGPTTDGRIKPEVVARGVSTSVIRSSGNIGTASGTSFAAPLVAGMAACIWESQPSLTAMQLRDTIISISSNFQNPNNQFGYGIPQFGEIIASLEGAKVAGLTVFPNPTTSNTVTISGIKYRNPKFILVDMSGKKYVLNTISEVEKGSYDVSLSEFSGGTYFIEVYLGNRSQTIKILKR